MSLSVLQYTMARLLLRRLLRRRLILWFPRLLCIAFQLEDPLPDGFLRSVLRNLCELTRHSHGILLARKLECGTDPLVFFLRPKIHRSLGVRRWQLAIQAQLFHALGDGLEGASSSDPLSQFCMDLFDLQAFSNESANPLVLECGESALAASLWGIAVRTLRVPLSRS